MSDISPTLLERFEGKLQREGDCIVFIGRRNNQGYGEISNRVKPDKRKMALAHRVAWRLKYGVWPTGILRHTCDNPACVRIKHLIDGGHKDNVDDKVAKGRQAKGESTGSAKLTEAQVLEIRALCSTRVSINDIAEQFGVANSTIRNINSGRTWGHLPAYARKPYSCQHIEIAGDLWTVEEIAAEAGVSGACIRSRLEHGVSGVNLLAGRHRAPRKPRGS